MSQGGATWLMVEDVARPGDRRPAVSDDPRPEVGTAPGGRQHRPGQPGQRPPAAGQELPVLSGWPVVEARSVGGSGQSERAGRAADDQPVPDQPVGDAGGPPGSSGQPAAEATAPGCHGRRGAGRRSAGRGPGGPNRRRRSGGSTPRPSRGPDRALSGRRRPNGSAGGSGSPSQRGAPATHTVAPRSSRACPKVQPRPAGTMASTRRWASAGPTGRPATARDSTRPALVSTTPTSDLEGEGQDGARRVGPHPGEGQQVRRASRAPGPPWSARWPAAARWRLRARRL